MATAPSVDEILGECDLYAVVTALLDARDKASDLGLALMLPPVDVESICNSYHDSQQRLTAIIRCFLTRMLRPTKKAIVDALRSPVVNLPRLAERVEATKLSNTALATLLPTTLDASGSKAVSKPTCGLLEQPDNVRKPEGETGPQGQSELPGPSSPMKVETVKGKIRMFEKRFNQLKWATRDTLKEKNVPVKKIVDTLADLPADDIPEHKVFLDGFLTVLYQAGDQVELFGTLNTHVNYLIT